MGAWGALIMFSQLRSMRDVLVPWPPVEVCTSRLKDRVFSISYSAGPRCQQLLRVVALAVSHAACTLAAAHQPRVVVVQAACGADVSQTTPYVPVVRQGLGLLCDLQIQLYTLHRGHPPVVLLATGCGCS